MPKDKKTKEAVKPVKKAVKTEKPVKKISKKADKTPSEQVIENVPSEEKRAVIEDFQVKPGDTGSPEVQVALLSKRIEKLVSHLKENPSDNHSRRGLLGIVSKRRRLLNYLEKKDNARYKTVVKKVGLSK